MRIKEIRIPHYKSLANVSIVLPDAVTAIVGRNNSGKSALLDAVLVAAESAVHGNVSPPPPVSARGDLLDLSFGRRLTQEPVEVQLTLEAIPSEFGLSNVASAMDANTPVTGSYTVAFPPGGMNRRVHFTLPDGSSFEFAYGGPAQQHGQGIFCCRPTRSVCTWQMSAGWRRSGRLRPPSPLPVKLLSCLTGQT